MSQLHDQARERQQPAAYGTEIKWTRAVKADLQKGVRYTFDDTAITEACYRPFVKRRLYFHQNLNEMQYQLPSIFGRGDVKNRCMVISDATAQKPWMACAVEQVPDLHFVGAAAGTVCIPFQRVAQGGTLADNITDWALRQFTAHYADEIGKGKAARKITREAIFHYCYAVLRADPAAGSITLDAETTLRGIPPEAWAYKLGNRSALDWVLDQYKEKKPKDPTIREKFDTYRFADYKDKVIDLLLRVTTVSVETMKVVDAMKAASR
jgi:predicted helicase